MIVRCKLCGTDHPYREDIERMECEVCETPLKLKNQRQIVIPRQTTLADPLAEM